MQLREERIIVETDRYRVTGVLHIPRDGYRSRMTDFLNESERSFLAMTDVEIAPLDGSPAEHRSFVALSVAQIVLAMPAETTEQDAATAAHGAVAPAGP